MSSSKPQLLIDAEPGVTITVFDASLAAVADGTGTLNVQLPPGLYELQFVAGHGIERHVIRHTSKGTTFTAPPVDFPSPAPLSPTDADDAVAGAASRLSRRPKATIGTGAELLVVVSDESPAARANAAAGLSLRTIDGRRLADLEQQSTRSAAGEQPLWAVTLLELSPGPYVLRAATGHGTHEQTVVMVDGWQTQVFLDRKTWGPAPARRRASLPDGAILMARRSVGFDPSRPDLRLTELARVALLDRRDVLAPADIDALVYGKWDNPMLGLYGANVLLATGRRQIGQLDTMRRNLRRLLGDHPDVQALDARAGQLTTPIRTPPMLRVSWDALVAATAKQPELIPVDAPAAQIADRLFGTGVWLTWQAERPKAQPASPPLHDSAHVALTQLTELLASSSQRTRARRTEQANDSLTSVGESILALASELAREASGGRPLRTLSDHDIVELLGAPQSVVSAAASDALKFFA